MGIKGLFSFMKRWDRTVILEEAVKEKAIGVDLFWFLHRSKGSLLKLKGMMEPLLNADTVVAVIDGKEKTEERRKELEERRTIREDKRGHIEEVLADIERSMVDVSEDSQILLEEYMVQLKQQLWTPSPDYIKEVTDWLVTQNVNVITAEGEADEILVDLERAGTIALIVSNDSDVLVMGAENVLQIDRGGVGKLFSKKTVMSHLRFDGAQWDDFMWLCKNMKTADVLLAFSLISVYGDVERALQRWEGMHGIMLV